MRLERALAASLAAAALLSTGCYVPSYTTAPERALAIYREARAAKAKARAQAQAQAQASGKDGGGAGESRTLTADQAVQMALENSAHLAEMNARVATAEAVVEEEGQFNNPELRISGVQLDQVLRERPQLGLGLRFSPDRPGEIDAKVAMARGEARVVRAEALIEGQLVEEEVRWTFENVLLFDAEIDAAEAEVKARSELAAAVKARMERSQATRVDEALASLASEESSQESEDLRAQREVAMGALLDRVGLSASAPSSVRLVGAPIDPALLPELPGEEALVEAALAARPELEAAAARMDAASAGAYIERAKRWPWLSFVQLGYDFEPGVRKGLGWTFGAAIELPIFSQNSGSVLRADAQTTEARRGFEAAVARVAREVRDRLREARAVRDLARGFRKSAVPAVDHAASEVKAAFDAGQSDLLQMAMVEEKRSGVRRQRLKLLRRYYEAMAALRLAVGGRMPGGAPVSPGAAKEPSK